MHGETAAWCNSSMVQQQHGEAAATETKAHGFVLIDHSVDFSVTVNQLAVCGQLTVWPPTHQWYTMCPLYAASLQQLVFNSCVCSTAGIQQPAFNQQLVFNS